MKKPARIFASLGILVIGFCVGKIYEGAKADQSRLDWESLSENSLGSSTDEFIQQYSGTENSASLGHAYKITPVREGGRTRNNVEVVEYRAFSAMRSLEELPEAVRAKLDDYLKNWLGKDYKNTIKFKQGYVFDIEEIHRKDPDSLNYKWEIPKYSIQFCADLPAINPCYIAGIEMRDDGTVLKEINFPPTSIHAERVNLLSEDEVFKISAKQNLLPDIPFNKNNRFFESSRLGYSRRAERFLYGFTKTLMSNSGGGKYITFFYDAQTGKYWGYSFGGWIY